MDNRCFLSVQDVNNFIKSENDFNIRIFHVNIRSLNKNLDSLKIVLSQIECFYDFIVLTETWKMQDISLFEVPGYSLIYNYGSVNQNDGVAVYIRENINFVHHIVTIDLLNIIQIEVFYEGCCMSLVAVYRPHDILKDAFNRCLQEFLSKNKQNKNINIILGDTNFDLLSGNDLDEEYHNILTEYGYTSLINTVTRPESATCLDHVFIKTEMPTEDYLASVFHYDLTDHYPIMLFIRNSLEKSKEHRKSRSFINYPKLNAALASQDWRLVLEEQNPNVSTEAFIGILKFNISESTYRKFEKKTEIKRKEWITSGIVKAINEKNKLYRQIRTNPQNQTLINKYRIYKNLLEKLIMNAKKVYYATKLVKYERDPKKLWSFLGGKRKINIEPGPIVNNNVLLEKDQDIAEAFNTYFSNIGRDLAGRIDQNSANVEDDKNINNLTLEPTNETEMLKIVKSLKSDKAPGLDGITTNTLKNIASNILVPLCHVVNSSMRFGVFPDVLKESLIKPVYKSGDRKDVSNYRPISLTSNLSKIFEKIIHERTAGFLESCQVLKEGQFGFRKGKSTQDAVAQLTAKIYRSLDSSKPCLCLFIDLKKAFDTVNHEKLLKTLEGYGIRHRALNWFGSYLSGRSQRVQVRNHLSTSSTIQCGVPQGTILGPLLFIAYLNSIFTSNTEGELTVFADDTAIFYHADTWEMLKERVERDFVKVVNFFNSKLLTINYDKTCFMPFSATSVRLPPFRSLSFSTTGQSYEIKIVDKFKYLGIYLDKHLRWSDHIEHLARKLRVLIPRFRKLRDFCKLGLLKRLYFALAQTHLNYGILAWGGVTKSCLRRLEIAQKWLLKIILRRPFRFPTERLYAESGVMDPRKLFFLALSIHQKKHLVSAIFNNHLYDTRNRGMWIVHSRTDRTIGQRSHTYLAPFIFNKIPPEIKNVVSMNVFKRKIKEWLISLPTWEVFQMIDLKNSYVHT